MEAHFEDWQKGFARRTRELGDRVAQLGYFKRRRGAEIRDYRTPEAATYHLSGDEAKVCEAAEQIVSLDILKEK
jgi:hypothetical protein